MSEIILPRPRIANRSTTWALLEPVTIAVAASLLVALCAHLSIPLLFTPVPISLAPFAVLFLGLLLGPRLALASLSLYLLEGAIGLPVFSPQGPVGILHLLGPTGGYLLSYPVAGALAGYLYPRGERSFMRGLIAAGLASLVILLAGALWLKLITHMDARLVLAQAVVPFLPGDVLKVCAAAGLAKAMGRLWDRHRGNNSLPADETL